MVPFLIIFIVFNGVMHWMIWKKCIKETKLPIGLRRVGSVLLVGLFVFLITSVFLSRKLGWLAAPAFVWMALSWFMGSVFACIDLLQKLVGVFFNREKDDKPEDEERRLFMRRMVGGGVVLGSTAKIGSGLKNALSTPKVKVVELTLKKLPPLPKPFVMIQLSDVHVGNTIGRDYIQAIADSVNEQDADLVVITGDLVDGSVEELAHAVEPLSRLKSKYGTFFSTGNHEYYSGADSWCAHLESIGIKVLRNEHVWIGEENSGFYLAGIDDAKAGSWPGHGPDLQKALEGCDRAQAVVLLAHQPKQVFDAKEFKVDLQLSGHTHGGQIWPWHYVAKASQKGLLAGHSLHAETQLYISRGTGYWGPPIRTFASSEITRILLNG